VAQALRDGFRRRCGKICKYLAGADGGLVDARELPTVVERLRDGFRHIRRAFVAHGLALHAAAGVGLA
jgi:hypothetical protein